MRISDWSSDVCSSDLKLTPFLIGMIKDGEIVLHRTNGPGKNVTSAHITPVGAARLDAILKRFGPDFGPISSIDRIEPISTPKIVRRRRLRSPEDLRTEAQKRPAFRSEERRVGK